MMGFASISPSYGFTGLSDHRSTPKTVMPGLVPGIYVDGRNKSGHDNSFLLTQACKFLLCSLYRSRIRAGQGRLRSMAQIRHHIVEWGADVAPDRRSGRAFT